MTDDKLMIMLLGDPFSPDEDVSSGKDLLIDEFFREFLIVILLALGMKLRND